MLGIFVLETVLVLLGVVFAHEGLFEFGREIGKYTIGIVLGALASGFADKTESPAPPAAVTPPQ
jgi:hypothetical protein